MKYKGIVLSRLFPVLGFSTLRFNCRVVFFVSTITSITKFPAESKTAPESLPGARLSIRSSGMLRKDAIERENRILAFGQWIHAQDIYLLLLG